MADNQTVTAVEADSPAGEAPAGHGLPGARPGLLRSPGRKLLIPLSLFALAMFLRWGYNSFLLDVRLCHFGDAHFFLTAGTKLLKAVTSGQLGGLLSAHASTGSGVQMMTSTELVDRLLIDGPVVPAYLAVCQLLLGINPQSPAYDTHCFGLSMCNAVLDSLTCVLLYAAGRLAFDRRVALLAAVVYAFYPAFVINTQHCYAEPVAYFLLTAWTCLIFTAMLRHALAGAMVPAIWGALGALSGLVMLARPAFVALPPFVLLVVCALRFLPQAGRASRGAAGGAAASGLDPAWGGNCGQAVPAASQLPPFADLPPAADCPSWAEAQSARTAADGRQPAGGRRRSRVKPAAVLCFLLGLGLTLAPWLAFTASATGRPSLFVNRVPTFNLFIGNYLKTDGWKAYPLSYFVPVQAGETVRAIAVEFAEHPLELLGLELRKVTRLWGGVWNENGFVSPFMQPPDQEFWHRMILFNAFMGLLLAIGQAASPGLSRTLCCAAVLAAIGAFHFCYIVFEPISRYNSTAMPSLILLAGYALLTGLFRLSSRRRWYLASLLLAGAIMWSLVTVSSFIPALAAMLPAAAVHLLPWGDALMWSIAWLGLGAVVWRAACYLPSHAWLCRLIVLTGFGAAVAITWAYSLGQPERKEWHADISNWRHVVRQDIFLPPMASTGALGSTSFVLLDMQSGAMLPRLAVAVNGQPLPAFPVPWLQLKGSNREMIDLLSIQSQAMGGDIKWFRQWWAIPVPTSMLRFGQSNEIMIKKAEMDRPFGLRVFGDYCERGQSSSEVQRILPSFDLMSWEKGFATFDRRDARVYEPTRLLGRNADAHWYDGDRWADDDLSPSPGRQFGEYRIRLALCAAKGIEGTYLAQQSGPSGLTVPPFVMPPVSLIGGLAPRMVLGNDPGTMLLTDSPLKVPEDVKPNSLFLFSCELSDPQSPGWACVSVQFSGEDNGKPVAWSSLWQPARIPTGLDWNPVSFSDEIPERITRLKNLAVTILVSPFPPDRLFMKRREALRDSVAVRNATFSILPPWDIPPPGDRSWLIY